MNLLFVSPRYPPAAGGAEQHLAAIAEYCAGRGHLVTVATTTALDIHALWDQSGRRLPATAEMVNGVEVRRFPVRPLPGGELPYRGLRRGLSLLPAGRPLLPLAQRLACLAPAAPTLNRWLRRQAVGFDLIAAFNVAYEGLMLAAARAAERHGWPYVAFPLTHLGAGPAPGIDEVGRFYTMTQQIAAVGSADLLVAQTASEAEFYQMQTFPPRKTIVVGPGVFPDRLAGGRASRATGRWGFNRPVVLVLGTLSPDKGTVATVQAAQALWAAGVDFNLVLAGKAVPGFKQALPQKIQQDARFFLLGAVSEEGKKDLLAAAAMLVMPSRVDSFGLVYLEAWLYGLPVIGADSWGVRDLIHHGENGLLIPFGNIERLSEAMAILLQRPELAQRLGAGGRELVLARHTWEHKLPLLEQAFSQLAPANRSGDSFP